MNQRRAINRTAQFEAASAGPAIAVRHLVFVDRHAPILPRVAENYQLDFVTPGIIPAEASSRKVMREILNRRMYARRRPLTWQRLTSLVGLASRGSWASEE